MKVGIWLNADYAPEEGGGFSYYDKLVQSIDAYHFSDAVSICFVSEAERPLSMRHPVVQLSYTPRVSWGDKVRCHIPISGSAYASKLAAQKRANRQAAYREQLRQHAVDVLLYPCQGERHVEGFPFVAMNWDIGHASTYAFPELCADGVLEKRQYFYQVTLHKALAVLAESEAGREELIRYARLNPDRIFVVPIFAGNCVNEQVSHEQQEAILQQYGLQSQSYFFYPAQFWAHKNHAGLLQAFAQIVAKFSTYKLVLTGSDKGNLSYIKSLVKTLNLDDRVLFPGFIPQSHINTLYQHATALVMASYFGPTNMPPLEAMALGCPVICSDLAGHREQLADAAVYFDAKDTSSIVAGMETMIAQRATYQQRIQQQAAQTHFTIDHALAALDNALCAIAPIRATWS